MHFVCAVSIELSSVLVAGARCRRERACAFPRGPGGGARRRHPGGVGVRIAHRRPPRLPPTAPPLRGALHGTRTQRPPTRLQPRLRPAAEPARQGGVDRGRRRRYVPPTLPYLLPPPPLRCALRGSVEAVSNVQCSS